jgi:hypothetical protein
MLAAMEVILNDARRFAVRRVSQPILWDSYYSALRDPKVEGDIPQNQEVEDYVVRELKAKNLDPVDLPIVVSDYRQWRSKAEYEKIWAYYLKFGVMGRNLPEKSLEHYLAANLLNLTRDDVYVDVGSSGSPVAEIFHRIFGCESYMQDLVFPYGIHGHIIGGEAGNMPVKDGFASKMSLHCSFEHFEGNADIEFIREAGRVLGSGGRLCILPLYLFKEYAIKTDPTVLPIGTNQFEKDAVLFCAKNYWGNRHGRFYDVAHFIDRIVNNLNGLRLTLYRVRGEKLIDQSCYVKFIALFEKG